MSSNNYKALTLKREIQQLMDDFFLTENEGDKQARIKAKTLLKNYLIKTDDGSYTVSSDFVNSASENMHTRHGALSESREKFVKPAHLEGKDRVDILDICSGLGYNAASCLEYLDGEVEVNLDMVEISRETLALSLLLDIPLKSYEIIKKAVEDKLYSEGVIYFRHMENKVPERIDIKIHLDDARRVVGFLSAKNRKYDAIFLDPFSPQKSPELYTDQFLNILKNLLKEDGLILTYSAAAPVRAALINNGLNVGEGPALGRSGGTIASFNADLLAKQLSPDDERMIALSDAGTSFKDPDLNESPKSILFNRTQERKSLRGVEKFASTVKTPIYLNKEISDARLKRRVLKNLEKFGITNLNSFKARYLVCPQYKDCICGCTCENYANSGERILEMSHRLKLILNS
jgi:tRNA U34 5-methylaminomethyl-2-thiouridine-forming methyltransferase MnmC